ncbi:MAG: hypothetical protein QME60_08750 [Verrucomicrobiota bacterium]|nr:hypothetical protein [Verrucomicrobiota bacterium]
MKMLCCDPSLDVCNGIKARLEARDIACVVKHIGAEALLGGDQPLVGSPLPEVWIMDDTQFEHARQIACGDAADHREESEQDESPDA